MRLHPKFGLTLGFVTVAIMTALVMSAVTLSRSHANEWVFESGCSAEYRVSGTPSCLSVWWDNKPPASTGHAFGSTYGAQSHCSDYGTVVAHIDMKGTADEHFVLDGSSKQRGDDNWHDVRSITCCANASEICHKSQVKKNAQGNNKVYSGTGTTYNLVSVSTHADRFNYCAANADSVYCEENPEGDAFQPLSCGTYDCTVSDCDDGWDDSDAADDCTEPTFVVGMGDLGGGTAAWCRLDTQTNCTYPNGSTIGFSGQMFYVTDMDDLVFCPEGDTGQRLKVDPC